MSKKFGSENYLGQKNWAGFFFGSKNILVEKNSGSKNLGRTFFWVKKFGSDIFFGQKNVGQKFLLS